MIALIQPEKKDRWFECVYSDREIGREETPEK